MKHNSTLWAATSTLALATLGMPAAWATNGTMPHGYGIKAMGMGGASIAYAQDAVAAANNPAGMAFVGHRVDVGMSVVLPKPEATMGGQHMDGSGVKAIAVPDFGYNRPLDARQSVGVSVYGNGVATQYKQPIDTGSSNDGARLTQVIIAPTYALQIQPGQAIGVSLNLAYQRFNLKGVQDASGAENQGTASSTGVGFALGWSGKVHEQLTLGAMYAARVRMGKLGAYSQVLANGGEFDIPERYGLGMAWKVTPAVVVAADVMRVNWGKINSLGNALTNSQPGFGWRNQTVTRMGVAWDVNAALTVRTGVSYGSRIISSDSTTLNYLAPVTPQKHLSVGMTYKLDRHSELSFMAARAYGDKVKGTGASAGVDVHMSQNWLGLSWATQW